MTEDNKYHFTIEIGVRDYELDSEGKPTADIPADSPFKKALYDALDTLEL